MKFIDIALILRLNSATFWKGKADWGKNHALSYYYKGDDATSTHFTPVSKRIQLTEFLTLLLETEKP